MELAFGTALSLPSQALALADLQHMEKQIGQSDREIAPLLGEHQDAVQRLAEAPI